MCSIGGFISSGPLDRASARRLCRALLYYGTERGDQSAGIYVNGTLLKRAISPAALGESSEFFNLFQTEPTFALLHTRQPTSGGLGDEQAQPFQVNETVTVHNGMFFDVGGIKSDWTLKKTSGVDSELITRFISSYGIRKLPDFIESTDGPSAIAAHSQGSLYLMRSGNPIVAASFIADDVNLTVFASTARQLKLACAHAWLWPKGVQVKETAEHVLLRVTPMGVSRISKRCKGPTWPITRSLGNWGAYDKWDRRFDAITEKEIADYYRSKGWGVDGKTPNRGGNE